MKKCTYHILCDIPINGDSEYLLLHPLRIRRSECLYRLEHRGGVPVRVFFGKIVRASYSDTFGGVFELDVNTQTGLYHSIISRRALRRARQSSALIVIA